MEETIAFIDCSAGVAGDMLLGALIDAGAPLDEIVSGLRSLRGIDGEWTLRTSRVWKGPGRIAGTKVHVDSIYRHRELAPPGSSSRTSSSSEATATVVVPEITSPALLDHSHSHDHDQNHDHSHDDSHHHSHDHNHSHSHSHEHSHEHSHSHDHDHGHDHSHSGDESSGKEPMRNLDDITRLVLNSELSAWAKAQSVAVFTLLAQAEAHTHGTTVDAIHFHEVGAIDSIIDTVGSVLALDLLGVRRVYSSFLPFSSGTVKCLHGILPVPPPATFRLMLGVPVCPAPRGATGELVTPTGISLVKALASAFGEPPAFVPTHTGVGAGTKEFPHHANIVRVAIGTLVDPHAATKSIPNSLHAPGATTETAPYTHEDVVVLETNVDDVNPQVIGFVFEQLLAPRGPALDVWTQPVQMKKSRPGLCVSVLCQPQDEDAVLRTLFQETTTLGVRKHSLQRVFLRREIVSIRAFDRSVDVKLGYYGQKLVNVYPEYEHCKAIARETATPLLDVIHTVQTLAQTFLASSH